jgi:predicted ATP-dependent endonuclease of OLD family
MRISKLKIDKFKNVDVDLKNQSSVIAFIGNNGSGKSNILEAISIIFHHLFTKKEKDIPFNFLIEYKIGVGSVIKIEKTNSTIKFYVNETLKTDIQSLLPKQIVAIYSGEENRLWQKSYEPIYKTFISNINKVESSGLGDSSQLPKMLYINKFYWHISLLCLLISDNEDAKKFCEEILNIKFVNSIRFDFNKPNYENYSDSTIKQFFQAIDKKSEYSLEELKELINSNPNSLDQIYKFLYIGFTPDKKKMLENIVIKFNDENIDIEDFSEGEKKMLLIKAALEFAGLEDSLFILDEPDAHIHLNNKIQIKNVFEKYKDNRQIIFTTHSPTLTDSLEEDSLFMLNAGKLVPDNKQEILKSVSGEFWNKFQQNAFLASKKPIILLVEGKHDKEHITNAYLALSEEYKDLNFEIFQLNTESHILPFMRGLYESDFETGKLYIGVYDNDSAVEKSFNNGYEKVNDNFKKLKESNGKKNNNYFTFKLPKPEGITCDCTIETLYNLQKFEDAIQTATTNALGHLKNKSINDITKGIKDQAKNILSENSKAFKKEDFKNFIKLFELIREIKNYSEGIANPKPTELNTESKTLEKAPVATVKKISVKDSHLAYWTSFSEYVSTQSVSFKLQSPAKQHWMYISIGRSDFKISVISNTQKQFLAVQLLCLGSNALKNFRTLKEKYEQDAKLELSQEISWDEKEGKKEHHINYIIHNKNPLNQSDWENQHSLLCSWVEKFYQYFKDKIDLPVFSATISPLKIELGKNYKTTVKFRGSLKNGFFDNMVENNATKQVYWHVDKETFPKSGNTVGGILHGKVNIQKSFLHSTEGMEKGQYTVYARVYNHLSIGQEGREVVSEQIVEIEII